MFAIFGLRLIDVITDERRGHARARGLTRRKQALPVVIVRWGDDLDRCWREAVHEGWGAGASWTLCWNALELRVVDAARPWGRRHVAFDLARCATDPDAFATLWAIARAEALEETRTRSHVNPAGAPTLLGAIARAASREREAICTGLEHGVTEALVQLGSALASSWRSHPLPAADEVLGQSLTVIYRLLFLLYAEARLLVPMWHRTYREAYSIEALREDLERQAAFPGFWPAVQAISRLAHRGCRIGTLRVTPFNGHLFAPQRAPLVERARLDDAVLRRVLEALTTTTLGKRQRRRIAFADLGVEQLGSIYERVLDHRLVFEPDEAMKRQEAPARTEPRFRQARLTGNRADRKASATFYTPRPLTDLIVRRTLAPLVDGASSSDILRLRVLDPAMGSGAFLVAACRYLARAYEAALVVEQQLRDHELDERDRAGFRRLVARRCLYGVDRNPMAVQLAQLSLWLATLAAEVPLTFLDHHLRVGNSLVGASLADLLRQPPGRTREHVANPRRTLPLLASTAALEAIEDTVPVRLRLEDLPDDTLDQVRYKERLLAELEAHGAPLSRWRDAADLWCAVWFWREKTSMPRGALYSELLATTLERQRALRADQVNPLLSEVEAIAADERFFHWTFEFPEVFSHGHPAGGGFDAVLGNPPWHAIGRRTGHLAAFVRDAGIYAGAADAHGNAYLLFVERALQLLRPAGRLGLLVPWGLAGDQGASRVRRALLQRCALDSSLVIDNRQALFPIHRSVRLLVITGTHGTPTHQLPLQHIRGEEAALDACPERSPAEGAGTVPVSCELLSRMVPQTMAVPEIRSSDELRLLERLWRDFPALSSEAGWSVRFGRELNATEDRALFKNEPPGLSVLEGKHVEAFRIRPKQVHRFMRAEDARRRLPSAPFSHARVAYRDVASPTNQRTLIAAVVPRGAVTTHTLFCCRNVLGETPLWTLCALLNSLVADWIARRWVSTHVTVGLVEHLPVPGPASLGTRLEALADLARGLEVEPDAERRLELEGRLQAIAAGEWRVTSPELDLILKDFPLVDARLKQATRRAFATIPVR